MAPQPSARRRPGQIRDAIVASFEKHRRGPLSIEEVLAEVQRELGGNVAASSVRSYLRLNTPGLFERSGRGLYKLCGAAR